MKAELLDAVDAVRSDLLADAVDTLTTAATAQEAELRRRFEEGACRRRMSESRNLLQPRKVKTMAKKKQKK